MHLSTIDFARFKSKVRWYQSWELLKGRWHRQLLQLYRWYHRDFCVAPHLVRALPPEWTAEYGTDVLGVPVQSHYRWDEEMLRLFETHGTRAFSKLAIWDVDWELMYQNIYGRRAPHSLKDPRSRIERRVHRWLEDTQPAYAHGAAPRPWTERLSHRMLERCLTFAGW
jgi:hypothetical protein